MTKKTIHNVHYGMVSVGFRDEPRNGAVMRRYFTFVPVTNRSQCRGNVVTSSVIMMSVDRGVMLDLWKASRSKIARIRHKIDISKRRVLIGVQDLDGRQLPNPCLSIRIYSMRAWGPSRETQ